MRKKTEMENLCSYIESASVSPPRVKRTKDRLANNCMRFAELYVERMKPFKHPEDKQSFAILLGEETYLRVLKNKPIYNIMGYTRKSLPGIWELWGRYHNTYYNEARRAEKCEYIPGLLSRCTSSESYSAIDDLCTIELLESLFADVNKFVTYNNQWTSKVGRLNAHLTLVLSLRNGAYTPYHLNERDSALCRLLYNRFKFEFAKILDEVDRSLISDRDRDLFASLEIFLANGQIQDEER